MGIACGILELACKSVPLLVDQPAKNKNKIIIKKKSATEKIVKRYTSQTFNYQ